MIHVPSPQAIRAAARFLARGELVGIPTETVYGLAAKATDADAVNKIFAAKGRPATNPLIVHIADADQLDSVIAWPPDPALRRRLDRLTVLWPGPLTLVCPRSETIPDSVTAGQSTVAVRIPDHPVALDLLRACNFPLAAPSANPSNYISPTRAQHVAEGLGDRVAMVLDGGPCRCGIESTILSLVGTRVRLLRAGSLTVEQIEQQLDETVEVGSHSDRQFSPSASTAMEAPGMLHRHYSPKTPLWFVDQIGDRPLPRPAARLAFGPISASEAAAYDQVRVLADTDDLQQVAHHLFDALRDLDRGGYRTIVVDTCAETGLGRAIMDRLRRAAALS